MGPSSQGGESFWFFFARTHFLACEDVAGRSQQLGGNVFFAKYRGPFGGSQISGGGIIILRVIRRHFLACGRGPSSQPLHVQYYSNGSCSLTTLTTPRGEHHGGGRRRGLARGRRGAGEDAAVEARAERSTRVHWFGCGLRLPLPQGLASGGHSSEW